MMKLRGCVDIHHETGTPCPRSNHLQTNQMENKDPIKDILEGIFLTPKAQAPVKAPKPKEKKEQPTEIPSVEDIGKSFMQGASQALDNMVSENKRLHDDWNRTEALINEFSCGNRSTKASMFYHAYSIVQRTTEMLESVAQQTDIPSPLCEILELSALEVLTAQMKRRVSGFTPDQIKKSISMIEGIVSPKKNAKLTAEG